MSMTEPSSTAFNRSMSGHNDAAFVAIVEDTVRRICQAESVFFEMRRTSDVLKAPSDGSSSDATQLSKDLATFLRQESPASTAKTCAYRDRNNREFIFVRLPLIARETQQSV